MMFLNQMGNIFVNLHLSTIMPKEKQRLYNKGSTRAVEIC